jgi:hypothetical protein
MWLDGDDDVFFVLDLHFPYISIHLDTLSDSETISFCSECVAEK